MALLASLVIILMTSLVAITTLNTASLEEKMAGNQKLAANAMFGAERGLHEAIGDLLDGTITDADVEAADPNPVGPLTLSATDYDAQWSVAYHKRRIGGADAKVSSPRTGSPFYKIVSTGTSVTAQRQLTTVVCLEYPCPFSAPLIGCEGVELDGHARTGSYSSSGQSTNGDRGDIRTTDASAVITLDGNASVNGDLWSAGAVDLLGSSIVRSDIYANGGVNVSGNEVLGDLRSGGSVTGDAQVDGEKYQNQSPLPVPAAACDPLDIDALFAEKSAIKNSNDNAELDASYSSASGVYVSSSGSATIGADGQQKRFYFQRFTLDSDAVVTIRGEVEFFIDYRFWLQESSAIVLAEGASLTIYLDGGEEDLTLKLESSTGINDPTPAQPSAKPYAASVPGYPSKVQIFTRADNAGDASSDSDEYKVVIDSNGDFYGVIYAPRAYVISNADGQLHGSIRGRYVTLASNAQALYDEDLAGLCPSLGTPTGYKMVTSK